jgi:hypothetical protein
MALSYSSEKACVNPLQALLHRYRYIVNSVCAGGAVNVRFPGIKDLVTIAVLLQAVAAVGAT